MNQNQNQRRIPSVRRPKNSHRPQSPPPPSAHYSANSYRHDDASRSSHDISGYAGGLKHNSRTVPFASAGKQFDSTSAADHMDQHDCRASDVKSMALNMGNLNLGHDSSLEMHNSGQFVPSNSKFEKDFPSPSGTFNPQGTPLSIWGAKREQAEHTKEESCSLPHFDTSYIVDDASLPQSSQTTDMDIHDRRLEEGIQCRKSSQGKTGFTNQLDISHYDICPLRTEVTVRLKAPLHLKNRELRNDNKRNKEGHGILILRPGMILLKRYISFNDQVKLITTCRELGLGPGGFYQPGYRDGAKLNLKMMCLGKNWDPESSAYGDERPSDSAKPPLIPDEFFQLVKRVIKDSHVHLKEQRGKRNVEDILPPMSPNICIVNFYTKSGRLGLHQDKDESQESLQRGLPVVSFSIGDSADFVYGDQRDISQVEKVILESGDVLIFGGQARHIYHGVAAVLPDTAPKALLEETNLRPGRLNLTFREY